MSEFTYRLTLRIFRGAPVRSDCQSIVFKLMNFPTLVITTQNSNSLNGWGGSSSQIPLLTDRWFGESDLASSNKGYTGYREVLGGIGGPNQANLEA